MPLTGASVGNGGRFLVLLKNFFENYVSVYTYIFLFLGKKWSVLKSCPFCPFSVAIMIIARAVAKK